MTGVRLGHGLDVHAFADSASRPLVLCGVEVPGPPGLAGHSDGDVAAHAVADAVLGAAALGDLGSRFGVDDPSLAGARSLRFVEEVVADAGAHGWRLVNLDLTVVAQRPRLAPYRDEMRHRLARACRVDLADVSVKLTSTDHLGSIGRGEGIAAWATCLIAAVDPG